MPVPDARVRAFFVFFGSDSESKQVQGKTDGEGKVILTEKGETQVSLEVEKDGFYDSAKPVNLYESDELGYSRPFDPQVTIELKEVRNPVPMIARGHQIRLVLPSLSEPVGYDLFEDDWVAPYGNGEFVDVLFEYVGEVGVQEVEARLTATIAGGGFAEFEMGTGGSLLKSGYRAPEDVSKYSSSVVRRISRHLEGRNMVDNSSYRKGIGYYLMLRPRYDENGQLVAACYGKLYGDFQFIPTMNGKCEVRFSAFYVNPVENDRNVEFDTFRNLINPPKEERVRFP